MKRKSISKCFVDYFCKHYDVETLIFLLQKYDLKFCSNSLNLCFFGAIMSS